LVLTLALAQGAAAAPFAVPAELRLVNYYPAQAGWTYMWDRWDAAAIDRDFGRIQGLGANAVRLIVQPDAFGYPYPAPLYERRLAQAVALAAKHRLQVELTLFDWWFDYRHPGRSKQWAGALLAPYAHDPRIAAIELRNEIDPTDPSQMAWARALLPYVRSLVPETPLTLSVTGPDVAANLASLKQQLGTTLPDFWTIHFYEKPELALATFAEAKAVALPQPLYVGETGYYAGDSDPIVRTRADEEDEQARFLLSVANAAAELGLPPIAPWVLNDFSRRASPKRMSSAEYHYGLFRVGGTAKPAAAVVRRIFAAPLPDDTFDGGFETPESGTPVPEPALWRRLGAAEFRLDTSVAHGGGASASIGAVPGSATFHAVLSTFPASPWVSPGERATLTAWVRGEDATGTTWISLLYYDGKRTFLGRADSDPLPTGTTDWQQLSVWAIAPPGASYVRIQLGSSGNRGRVWFDDVALDRSS
jgi:hypothetical protein